MIELIKGNRIYVTVDNTKVAVYENLSILQALLEENIHIPHLCYDIRLKNSIGNCGLCLVEILQGEIFITVKACETIVREGMVIQTKTDSLIRLRKNRLEELLWSHNGDCIAPCVVSCPAHIDIQRYLLLASLGYYDSAIKVIKENNPFPSVCGRVCPHPCENGCRRNLVDTPVAINSVKRFIADLDLSSKYPFIPKKNIATGKRIAIIGAGPSGLSAAYYSAIYGHNVTVFEQNSVAGGMMQYGIPEYRLPKKTLTKEIDILIKLGVNIIFNTKLGVDIHLKDLKVNFDAIYISIGAWASTKLNISGESSSNVYEGIDFLKSVIEGNKVNLGNKVIIIGGGNTAIDCARTCIRLGVKSVSIIYRRTKEEMPAEYYEVEEALNEGVDIRFLLSPNSISENFNTLMLNCDEMELGEMDKSGRKSVNPIPGKIESIPTDSIIIAIGQNTCIKLQREDLTLNLDKKGNIQCNPKTLETSLPGIFAGGDCVSGAATVIEAIASGHRAADSINSFLINGKCSPLVEEYHCSRGKLEELPKSEFCYLPKLERVRSKYISRDERISNFNEVELKLPEEDIKSEARRCLQCGCSKRYKCNLRDEATDLRINIDNNTCRPYIPIVKDHPYIIRDHNKCIRCGRCISVCSDLDGADILCFYYKDGIQYVGTKGGLPLAQTNCINCGQCVNACPCGALSLKSDKKEVMAILKDPNKFVIAFVAPAVRTVIASHFNLTHVESSPYTAGILKSLGFDRVFDFSFAADLTIMEEATEFLNRLETKSNLPQFTSCCPGWVSYIEKRYPELLPYLSTCKSPQQMMGTTVKNHFPQWAKVNKEDIYVVSIVPCIAKKFEASRSEYITDEIRDVDAVLTTTELLDLLKEEEIDTSTITLSEFDEPYKQVSGGGIIFGVSGGVSEAAVRMVYKKKTGITITNKLDLNDSSSLAGIKDTTIDIEGTKIRIAIISGVKNAQPLVEKLMKGENIDYDLIEVMACPGGCICGAGHPVPDSMEELERRKKVLLDIDKDSCCRVCVDNKDLNQLYDTFYEKVNSEIAEDLLHNHKE